MGGHGTHRPEFHVLHPREPLRPGTTLSRAQNWAKHWKASGAAYGAAAFMLMIFVTDWKVIADKIPGYNRKFFKD